VYKGDVISLKLQTVCSGLENLNNHQRLLVCVTCLQKKPELTIPDWTNCFLLVVCQGMGLRLRLRLDISDREPSLNKATLETTSLLNLNVAILEPSIHPNGECSL
jgi:hypothetical protein